MSLNGLDATSIDEAYTAVQGEPGGWFLLKYVTRDEVGLLKAGNGSFVEVRDTITEYPEISPLYGLVQYRRKKVLLKYLPEGTSRLLQARVAVHIQAIIEKFGHDSLVSFSSPTELSETTLSSSLSPLKASASITSSNSSLRRRRLAEIAEESVESPDHVSTTDQSTVKEFKEDIPTTKAEIDDAYAVANNAVPGTSSNGNKPLLEPLDKAVRARGLSDSSINLDKSLPSIPNTATKEPIVTDNPLEDHIWDGNLGADRRQSSQSARPTTRDIFEGQLYTPKVKLGPRPSLDYSRGHSSGSITRSMEPRPVSTLPAGLAMPSRKSTMERPQTQHTFSTPRFIETARMHHSTPMSRAPPTSSDRPTSKAGSVASIPTYAYVSDVKPSTTTPEKQRLMKALQMRKKQMERRNLEVTPPVPRSTPSVDVPVPDTEGQEHTSKGLGDGTNSDSVSDPVHSGVQDLGEGSNADSSTSPASLHDTLDELSTKASSLAERDESSIEQPASDNMIKPIIRSPDDTAPSFSKGQPNSEDCSVQNNRQSVVSQVHHPDGNHELLDETYQQSHLPNETSHLSGLAASTINQSHGEMYLPHQIPLPVADKDEDFQLRTSLSSPIHAPHSSVASNSQTVANESPQPKLVNNLDNPAPISHENKPRPLTTDSIESQNSERKTRRRGPVEPIRIVSNADQSEENFLSDESFMEELQSATVQEAKPISVSRSPVTPLVPMSPRSISISRSSDTFKLTRTSSNPLDSGSPQKQNLLKTDVVGTNCSPPKVMPTISPQRAVSSPVDFTAMQAELQLSPKSSGSIASRTISTSPTLIEQVDPVSASLSKRTGVSSLISQRIKALEKSSSSGSQIPSPTAVITPTLITKRKDSLNTTPTVLSPSDTPLMSNTWKTRKDLPYPTPSPSPHGTIVSRKFGSNKVSQATTPTHNKLQPDPTVFPASIVHDAGQQHAPSKVFKQSSRPKTSSDRSESSMSPEAKPDARSASRRDSVTSKRSTSSRKESADVPPSLSRSSSDGRASIDGFKEDKKESRKNRLFKRMSAITSTSRRNIAQALGTSVKEEPIVERQEPEIKPSLVDIDFGDLNIQFPDTLLWKRRRVVVDSQGFLILTPCTADKNTRVATKRYHLSEFRPPYIPDQDRQELPNSVILDFVDSSTIQCACESLTSQLEVSRALSDAYRAHAVTNTH